MNTGVISSINRRVVVVARQAGSASALAPVIFALRDQVHLDVPVFAFKYAFKVFERLKCEATLIESSSDVVALLETKRADVLLTGTSLSVTDDGALWSSARRIGIPSIGVLDHWCNYWERFTVGVDGPRFEIVPDRIALMDQAAFQAMVDAGCPAEILVVTGQPAFDVLLDRSWPVDSGARAALGIPPDSKVVLFASEPQAAAFGNGPEFSTFLGYTEDEVLGLLMQTLRSPEFTNVNLLIKPHPTEQTERLMAAMRRDESGRFQLLTADADPRRLLMAADAVIGMTSILLYEAAMMGRPSASLRPNARTNCDVVDCHPGLIADLKNNSDLASWLRNALQSPTAVSGCGLNAGKKPATQNMIGLLKNLSAAIGPVEMVG